LFVPINIDNTHWALVVVVVEDKLIQYYDSLGSNGDRYMQGILKFLQDYARERNIDFNVNEWTFSSEFTKDHPQVFFNFF